MSDINAMVVDPLKKFVKDSVYLVKKCTKPDRKGNGNVFPRLF
jgi:protein transport protein SEC61 subunit gamma and related proteins